MILKTYQWRHWTESPKGAVTVRPYLKAPIPMEEPLQGRGPRHLARELLLYWSSVRFEGTEGIMTRTSIVCKFMETGLGRGPNSAIQRVHSLFSVCAMSDSDAEMEGPSHQPEMVYNPDQDPDEKRRVRGNYRQLQADLDGATIALYDIYSDCSLVPAAKQTNPNDYTAEELAERIRHANVLFKDGGVKC
jgi:hypothetical protein